jgi:hypothetical protein
MLGLISAQLARKLEARLRPTYAPLRRMCISDPSTKVGTSERGGYVALFIPSTAKDMDAWVNLVGRAPDDWERPLTPGDPLLYVFELWVSVQRWDEHRPVAASFRARSTFDVWFPYVLAENRNYRLLITGLDPPIQAINGRLQRNVLHFVLPAFSLKAHKARGDIESQ